MFKVVGIDSHLEGELYGKSQLEENAQFSGRFFVEQIIVCSHVSMHGKTAGNVPVGSKPPCILTGKPPLLSRAAGEQNTVKTQNNLFCLSNTASLPAPKVQEQESRIEYC